MTDIDPSAAERVALDWLSRTDRGDAAGSWAAAAELFRNALSEAKWSEALNAARGPLGALVNRTLRSTRTTTELPGAPDGQYVVLEYTTSFEKKRNATETVVPMRDPDGQWRVSGYFIR